MAESAVRSKAVVLLFLLFIVAPIVGVCNSSLFCCTLLYIHTRFAIILMGKRERELFVFLMSRDCCVALTCDAMGLSAICDCGIS